MNYYDRSLGITDGNRIYSIPLLNISAEGEGETKKSKFQIHY